MRIIIIFLAFIFCIPSFGDTRRCEVALIDANSEEWLFQASERLKMPQDTAWVLRARDRILAVKAKLGAETAFALYTALLAGLDPETFKDPAFDREILKPWASLRREARRLWTFTPPRYNTRLMYKMSLARRFDYLYS